MTTPSDPGRNLLSGPPPTLLPSDAIATDALAAGEAPAAVAAVAAASPALSAPWAALAEIALAGDRPVEAYAYARTGYHRGLDALRRAGWRGNGPIPWSHEPNRGFLRSLAALARAAAAIEDTEEAARCKAFLTDSDPAAARALDFDAP
ncbi:DUF3151 domain-containing protein [Candidatus Frankia alpina]|uniref:DUF3151 domain-containing protein n=1 Tax=Candidatus Frankia alpina TaxID=2699483 RepID=A0A4S5EPR1_9ACTN|nr:DUF3151 domain-containing protein [Candidatus Frankia alpina]THJ74325.1 DUF3151 domain-containing protein [Candidatus Frankia alpina]